MSPATRIVHVVPPEQVRPALEATKEQLLELYRTQASAVRSLNATVEMKPSAGSDYKGVIQEYHDFGGFILARKPEMIRIIGQAPVVYTDIFDMASDGQVFRMFIPSKNQYLVGPTHLERTAKNAFENLRPQHILDALFWLELPENAPVLFEEFDQPPARYYVLTLLRDTGSGLEINRKIWFDRMDLRVSRVQIYDSGRVESDVSYSDWEPVGDAGESSAAAAPGSASGPITFSREISVMRPQQNYRLAISITKLALNGDIPSERFTLTQPVGAELVQLGERAAEPQP